MNNNEFKQWLINNQTYSSKKLISDCVSRAARVEKAFQSVDGTFTYQREYDRDFGESFCKLISRRGIDINLPIDLPIGTNQMDTLVAATKKYFLFLKSTD